MEPSKKRTEYIKSLSDSELTDEILRSRKVMSDAVSGVMASLEADAFPPTGTGLYYCWDYLNELLEEKDARKPEIK